jgi:hypothetical protein
MMTADEIDLLLDALARAASRHESMARHIGGGFYAGRHDDAAAKMRALRFKLLKERRQQSETPMGAVDARAR